VTAYRRAGPPGGPEGLAGGVPALPAPRGPEPPPTPPLPPTEHAALSAAVNRLLHRLGAATDRLVDVYARSRDMRSADLRALLAIRLAELARDPQTPGDLGQSLLMTSGAVTGLVDRLVRTGLVRREPDDRDRRRIRLRSTERGAALADALLDLMETRTGGVVSGLGIGELRVVERFLAGTVAETTGHVWRLESPARAEHDPDRHGG
jgi:MarR family transcriptional regulator, organic hydroperoxide resistance regulator